jgi:predicted transcriptional regulator
VRPGEIAEKTGIEKKELDKIIKVLRTEELIFSPKRCFYEIKK